MGGVVEIPESEPNSLAQESKLFNITPYYILKVLFSKKVFQYCSNSQSSNICYAANRHL